MNVEKSSLVHVGPSSAVELAGKEPEEPKISLSVIKSHLSYDEYTGVFRWISVNKHYNEKLNKVAGTKNRLGYILIQINGIKVKAHRLAWFYKFGYMPFIIDHINGVKSDNRLCNLRNSTNLDNAQNHLRIKNDFSKKASGLPVGVKLLKSGRYQARASAIGVCYSLGTFKTAGEAHEKYKQFTERNHSNPAVC